MTNQLKLRCPAWQSGVLLGTALTALAFCEYASGFYAWKNASLDQVLVLWGFSIPLDAVIKTGLSIVAGITCTLGFPVAMHLWRTGRKGLQRQAKLAFAVSGVAAVLTMSNLSGYYAWTRDTAEALKFQTTLEYRTAADDYAADAQVLRSNGSLGQDRYDQHKADLATLQRGEVKATAERHLGDVGRASVILALIIGAASAFRLPGTAARKAVRRTKKAQPAQRGLRAVN